MRTGILCLLVILLIVCALFLNKTEGFGEVCIPFPSLGGNAFFIVLLIVTILGLISTFYIWNWDLLRTTTSTHIISRYLFNSKQSS
jgi:hypothetical protein